MAEYTDLIMVLGVVILGLAFPAIVSAFSRGAPPRMAFLAVFVGGIMILYANSKNPKGYTASEMPQLFLSVITGV